MSTKYFPLCTVLNQRTTRESELGWTLLNVGRLQLQGKERRGRVN